MSKPGSYDEQVGAVARPASDAIFARAVQALSGGQGDTAERICRQILSADPAHFDAHHLLGLSHAGRGDYAGALESFDRAAALRPRDAQLLSNRGLALCKLGRAGEAMPVLDAAISLDPNQAIARLNRGNILLDRGHFDDALADFDAALAAQPDFAALHHDRARALLALTRDDEALESVNRALAIDPEIAAAHHDRSVILKRLSRDDEAFAACESALAIDPTQVDALAMRGTLLHAMNRHQEARDTFDRVLAIVPGAGNFHVARCIAELAIIYRDETEIDTRRRAYETRLRALEADVEARRVDFDPPYSVELRQPFYLPYQGRIDRDLQAIFGRTVCRGAQGRANDASPPPPPRPGEKLRIGIVSGFFYLHSNWKMRIDGWLDQIDRARFDLFGYYTGTREDAVTRVAADRCRRFVKGPLPLERWRAEILADAPHVLIYPEIGMHAVSAALAVHRLARVQCVSWGHPTTSGLPTMDYFLTSDLMEPSDGQEHYTERLVRLPNLSVYYDPPRLKPVAATRAQHGLRDGAVTYWCCQSMFKFLPQYDRVFPAIAREAGDCQFVFIAHLKPAEIAEDFRDRLVDAFAAAGLECDDYCIFLPGMPMDEFTAVAGLCDVFLDSIGWSGCNTTLESMVHDLPIVTLPGPTMRSRHSAAFLRMMGISDTIAKDLDDYVAIAVRLARDRAWRAEMSAKVAANKHRLYRDRAAITALEDFLDRTGRSA